MIHIPFDKKKKKKDNPLIIYKILKEIKMSEENGGDFDIPFNLRFAGMTQALQQDRVNPPPSPEEAEALRRVIEYPIERAKEAGWTSKQIEDQMLLGRVETQLKRAVARLGIPHHFFPIRDR